MGAGTSDSVTPVLAVAKPRSPVPPLRTSPQPTSRSQHGVIECGHHAAHRVTALALRENFLQIHFPISSSGPALRAPLGHVLYRFRTFCCFLFS